MAYWNKTLRYTKSQEEIIRLGDGVNTRLTPFEIKKSEAVDSSNTDSNSFPALSARKGNTAQFGTDALPISNFNGAGARGNQHIFIVNGTTMKRWNGSNFQVVVTALENTPMRFAELNTQAKQYTLYCNGTDNFAYDGTVSTPLIEAPKGNLIAVDDNRLYMLKDRVMSYSAQGDPFDWTTLNDAGEEIITGMIGEETAIVAYNDTIIIWSDYTMHLAYGNNAEDITIKNPIRAGCISYNSVIEHKGVLYFMDYNSFKSFTGGYPEEVSDKINVYLRDINYNLKHLICSGAKDDYIYISIPYGHGATTNNMTIRYDVANKTWYPSHDKGYLQFVNLENDIYGISTEGVIEKLEDGTTNNTQPITWYHTTGILDPTPIKARKTVIEYWMAFDLPAGSTLNVSYSTSSYGNDFVSLQDFSSDTDSQYDIVMLSTDVLQEIRGYRLKFSGVGPCTIHYLEPHKRIKSR